MSIKKLAAILLVILLFEVFFEVGLFFYRPVTSIIIPEKTELLERVIYVNRTIIPSNETERSLTIMGVGVHSNNVTGELVEVKINLRPGTGRILVDTTFHSYGTDLQDSLYMIKDYVEGHTNTNLGHVDLIVRVISIAHQIQGTSGSAAMAVGLIALVEERDIQENIVMTGSLLMDGRIGAIDGLDTKIEIAEEYGIRKMLIPKSQCSLVPPFISIEIRCVKTIDEALNEMLI